MDDKFGIKSEPKDYVHVLELTEDERSFYKNSPKNGALNGLRTCRLTNEIILQNMKNSSFFAKKLSKSQRKSEFLLFLMDEPVALKYLAKIIAIANVKCEINIIEELSTAKSASTKKLPEFLSLTCIAERKVFLAC